MTAKQTTRGLPVWLVLLTVGTIAYFSITQTSGEQLEAAEQPHPATLVSEPAPVAEPLAVTAVALESAFDDNEVAAQLKYGTQPLLITGTLASIKLDSDNNAALLLDSGAFLPLRITLPAAQANLAADLKKGQTVTAICGELSEMMGKPFVKNCELQT